MCTGVRVAGKEKIERASVADIFVKRDGRETIAKYNSPFLLFRKLIRN